MKFSPIFHAVLVTALVLVTPLFGQQRTGQVLRHGTMTTEETQKLVELSNSSKDNPDAPPPLWSYSGVAPRDGRVYTSVSIGSSPYANLKATKIPVVVVPLVVTVGGVTLDPTALVTNSCVRPDWNGKTPLQMLLQSPIFTATNWTMNGVNMGSGQYLDAFQRAQYWSLVQGSRYHTVLDPVVADAQVVPASAIDPAASAATSACVAETGGRPDQITLGRSDTGLLTQWIQGTLIPALQAQKVINSQQLVYFLLYNTTFSDATGFHSYVGTQTYATSLINGSDCCAPDIATASHVLGEWMNDPLPTETQTSPGWTAPSNQAASSNCQKYSAVGDPSAERTLPGVLMPNGVSYHPQELTFQSWFQGAASIGAGGLYSNNASLAVDAGAVCHVAIGSGALTITSTTLSTGVTGQPYSQTLTATGGAAPYTWSLAGGRLPPGLTLSPAGVISGTPISLAGGSLIRVQVVDSSNPQETATASLEFPYFLGITTTSLGNGVVGAAYFQGLLATGGTPPYAWQLTAGTLPAGLTLSPAGDISGTPTSTVAATPLTFMVTDASSPRESTSASFTLTITGTPLSITTTALPNGVVGTSYSQALAAAGGTPPYAWQLTGGTLPSGLTLNTATGVIGGIPTSPASATPLTLKVTDSSALPQNVSVTLPLTIIPKLIGTPLLLNCVVGGPCSGTLTATGGVTPYTWQLISGTLPAGLTLNSATGAISGTPTAPLTATPFTVKVTDSGTPQQNATTTLTISVVPLQIITTVALPNGIVGIPYSQAVATRGGTTPFTWQLTAGTLPAGLSLNTTTGVISGTPTAPITATPLTFKVTDSGTPQQTASASLTLTIVAQLTAPSATLNCVVSTACSTTLTETGGVAPYTWQLTSGTLPAGMTLNPSTGQISGTPTAAMAATAFTFKVTDSGSPQQSATTTVTITVSNLQIITTVALPNGVVGTPYSQAVVATGGTTPYNWQLTAGTLPSGLSLNTLTGVVSGTPTSAVTATPLTFKVTDSGTPQQNVSVSLTLTILPLLTAGPALTLNCIASTPCSTTLTETGGVPPYTWQLTAGTLPAGLALNPSTGQISGTPTVATGPTVFTFKVTDSGTPQQNATTTVTISVGSLQIITTVALPNGVVGTPYSQAVVATGGSAPYTWQLTSGTLPSGLSLNTATGAVFGTPTSAVTATPLTFKVTDSGTPQQNASVSLTLTILPQLTTGPSLTLNCLLSTPCSTTLTATGGVTPYTWQLTAGTLPAGLTLNPATGQISGTPTVLMAATAFTFKVTDSGTPQQNGTTVVTISVASPVLQITTTSLATGAAGTPYSQTLTATGGIGPYTWSLKSGRLPSGITLNTSTGVISGTTSTATSILVTFQVTDSSSPTQQTATMQYTLTINSTP